MSRGWSPSGSIEYVQLPVHEREASAAFYRDVLGWETNGDGFEAPNVIGQWVTDRPPTDDTGPLLWYSVDDLYRTLHAVVRTGGLVRQQPYLDQGKRRLVEVADPAGNRLGLVTRVRPLQSQTMLSVADVESASRWYQTLLGLTSDHGGPEYERLLAGGTLVLQLHRRDVAHHHGLIGEMDVPVGNGVLVWFGEVANFDDVVGRAGDMGVELIRAPHRNPPEGDGNGPAHRELWVRDLDGYTVVVASPDGESWDLPS